jgi:hypothetical protein
MSTETDSSKKVKIKDAGFVHNVGFANHDTNQIFLESGFMITIQNESMDSQNESMFLRISYTIPASLVLTRVQL